jgi:hypothetical protein
VRDVVIDALLKEGATPEEIEKIVQNKRMNDVLSGAQDVRNLYGKGSIAVVVGNPSREEYEAQVLAQERRYDSGYLEASLNLFTDGAVALDEFATGNPRLAQLSLTALDAALSGPSRFITNYCGRELGLKDKIDSCKNKIHDWLSNKVSAITDLSPETSSLLVSGGVFGAGFAFYTLKLQDKSQILHDAKKVGEAAKKVETWHVRKAKIHGKAQKTGTPGHDWQSMKEAVKATKDPDVARVHMDQSLSKVTGGKVISRMRPDVSVVRKDGRINMIEVQSKSQRSKQLQTKIEQMQDTLPSEMRGDKMKDFVDVTLVSEVKK